MAKSQVAGVGTFERFVTTGMYARRAGLTTASVRKLIKDGKIPFHKVGGWARIPIEEYNKLPPLQAAQS